MGAVAQFYRLRNAHANFTAGSLMHCTLPEAWLILLEFAILTGLIEIASVAALCFSQHISHISYPISHSMPGAFGSFDSWISTSMSN